MSKVASPSTALGQTSMGYRDLQNLSILSSRKQLGPLDRRGLNYPTIESFGNTDEQATTAIRRERILRDREYTRRRPEVDDGYSGRVRSARLAGLVEPLDEADQADL